MREILILANCARVMRKRGYDPTTFTEQLDLAIEHYLARPRWARWL
jgi:hypothetical protein